MRPRVPALVKLLVAASVLSLNFVVFGSEAPCYLCSNCHIGSGEPDACCQEAPRDPSWTGYKECDGDVESPACGITIETPTCSGDLD